MKTKELINNLENAGFKVDMNDDFVVAKYNGRMIKIDRKIGPNDIWAKSFRLMSSYIDTPLDERQDEPKFRVRLKGFNADSGKQYLTCSDKRGSIKGQSFFGCHLQKGLCQEFTTKELDTLLELAKDRNQQWLAMLLSDPDNRELVEENND